MELTDEMWDEMMTECAKEIRELFESNRTVKLPPLTESTVDSILTGVS